jgi:hypothetical protein
VGLFSRGKSRSTDDETFVDDVEGAEGVGDTDVTDGTAEAGVAPAPTGPLDRGSVDDDTDYLNLGSIWLRGQQDMELRLEVNEQEQQIVGVTAVIGESAVQLQAFAAPRTEGVWIEIRNEIAKSITDAGGTAEVQTGEFGEELLTRMPQNGPDGRTVFMPARFVGVDGPRWFLRAVVSGRAAIEPAAAAAVHEVIRTAVVDRGEEAMPPRELLPLRLPDAHQAAEDADAEQAAGAQDVEDLRPFDRGPEITEVR